MVKWNLEQIPKIVHFYWGRTPLNFMRYLSVKSFAAHNPDWQILVHVPVESQIINIWPWASLEHTTRAVPDIDYFEQLWSIPGVQKIEHELSREISRWSDVHRSDYLRLTVVLEHGGFWSDFDVLYAKPMTNLLVNHTPSMEAIFCPCHSHAAGFSGYVIGLWGAAEQCGFVTQILNEVSRAEKRDEYQSIGSDLWNKCLPWSQLLGRGASVANLGTASVYHFNYLDIHDSLRARSGVPYGADVLDFHEIGIHWYGGDPVMCRLASVIDEHNYAEMGQLYSSIIEPIL